jgi:phosphate transport system permease protein
LLCTLSAIIVLIPLLSIFLYVVRRGLHGLSWSFFTELPKPVGELGGGMGNAVVGTLTLIAIASCLRPPRRHRRGHLHRRGRPREAGPLPSASSPRSLGGVPSITIGVFVYAFVVVAMKRFSGLAGGLALAVMMIPTVTRTTEELLRLVPPHLREASLGLGVSAWRTSLFIVVRTAAARHRHRRHARRRPHRRRDGPLLFTAFNNRYWSTRDRSPHGLSARADPHLRHERLQGVARAGLDGALVLISSSSSRASSRASPRRSREPR